MAGSHTKSDGGWESPRCPLCGSDDFRVVLSGRDLLEGYPGRFRIVRCSSCGLMRLSPRPTLDAMGLYYPDDYQPYTATRVAAEAPPPQDRRGLKERLKGLFAFHHEAVPPLAPGRMLEVGCASGGFLQRMRQAGWQVAGIEPSASAAEAARRLGLDVWHGQLENAPDPATRYDLVVGFMVLEHLHQPIEGLRKLRSWTAPDGWLVLSVPNSAGPWWRLFGDRWYDLSLPRHLFHFTPRTLRDVLQAGGWQVDRVLHQRIIASHWASLGYVLEDAGALPGLAKWLTRLPDSPRFGPYFGFPLALPLSWLGWTGRMTVWARPRDDA